MSQYSQAPAEFQASAASKDPAIRSRGFAELAALQAELGRYQDARLSLNAGIEEDEAAGRGELTAGNQLALAYLALREGKRGEVRVRAWNAVQRDPGPYGLLRAIVLLARAGEIGDARKLAAQAALFGPDTVYYKLIQSRIGGEILMASGKILEAVAEFRKTGALEPALRPREYLARHSPPRARRVPPRPGR